MRLYIDRTPVAHIDALLDGYASDEFASPTRSNVPLLALLRHGGEAIWQPIASTLGIALPRTNAHVEYKVAVSHGRSRASSHTDLMLIDGPRAIACEAKWTESLSEPVSEWLQQGHNPINKPVILDKWLALLQPFAAKPLRAEAFGDVVYQMLHRAASACAAGAQPALAYVHFTPSPNPGAVGTATLRDELTQLHALLGRPAGFPLYLFEVVVRTTPAFAALRAAPVESAAVVKHALRTQQLFAFEGVRVHAIG